MTLQVDLWHEIKKMGQKNKVISQLGKKKQNSEFCIQKVTNYSPELLRHCCFYPTVY